MDRFNDRVVLITGAASGIGRASAIRIAKEGGSIAAVDIDAKGLATLVTEIEALGGNCQAFECNLADGKEAIAKTVADAVEHFGKLNALCNIAGILRTGHSHNMSMDVWNQVIQVNLTGTFLMCQAAIPHLLATRGFIVNTGSTAALGSHPWMSAYAASKGGVISLTKCLAAEYVKQYLNVNAIVPGGIMTPLQGHFSLPEGGDFSLMAGAVPKVRMAGPDYAASVVAMLASDDARYMNGTTVLVDGGAMN